MISCLGNGEAKYLLENQPGHEKENKEDVCTEHTTKDAAEAGHSSCVFG